MAKKDRKTVVNNIDEINIEIDYDKLAEAIVKAETMAQSKQLHTGKVRSIAMRFMNGLIYCIIYVFATLCIFTTWSECYPDKTIPLYGCVIITILFSIIGIYAFVCQQESFKDPDAEAMKYFNSNVSLIALIVSLIALFMEVT